MASERVFEYAQPHRAYIKPAEAEVDQALYEQLSASGWANIINSFTVPARSAKAWRMAAGQTCRVVTAYGSQVGDVNMWSAADPRERLYTGKTRAIHGTHLTRYDRLWSCLPYLRPLATVTRDSLEGYGVDGDGCAVHDVIGTRCDPYMHRLITGATPAATCHQNLTAAATRDLGLGEADVHDVFNIFMCSGYRRPADGDGARRRHEYVIKASPSRAGDYIEWLAEVDLLVALSACPQGDVSGACGQPVPEHLCHPLDVHIGQPEHALLNTWVAAAAAQRKP